MTEKDAVKCMAFASNQHWYVPVTAIPETGFSSKLLEQLNRVIHLRP
jgi:tetraacyldisaccharide 4'-kinase